jgi:hypothetical protein
MPKRTATVAARSTIPTPDDRPLLDLWPEAARALGIGRSRAYEMAAAGDFPVEVLRFGARWKVRTADLRQYLRLDRRESAASA